MLDDQANFIVYTFANGDHVKTIKERIPEEKHHKIVSDLKAWEKSGLLSVKSSWPYVSVHITKDKYDKFISTHEDALSMNLVRLIGQQLGVRTPNTTAPG